MNAESLAHANPFNVRDELVGNEAAGRVDFLDIARGSAILGVVAVHTLVVFKTGLGWLDFLITCGQFGVQLFFVISAYTMCMTLDARSRRESRPVLKFLIRRFCRLALPFWCAMVLYISFYHLKVDGFAATRSNWVDIIFSALLLQGFWPTMFSTVVPGGGSIATEAAFYLTFPVLFAFRSNVRALSLIILATVLLNNHLLKPLYEFLFAMVGGLSPVDIKQFFHYYIGKQLPVFIFGMFAYAITRPNASLSRSDMACLFAASVVFLAYTSFIALVAIAAFAFVMSLNKFCRGGSVLTTLLVWLGRRSYSLYLFHFAVINVVSATLLNSLSTIGGVAGFFVAFLLALVASMLIAFVTKPLLEDRGSAMGKRIIASMSP